MKIQSDYIFIEYVGVHVTLTHNHNNYQFSCLGSSFFQAENKMS